MVTRPTLIVTLAVAVMAALRVCTLKARPPLVLAADWWIGCIKVSETRIRCAFAHIAKKIGFISNFAKKISFLTARRLRTGNGPGFENQ
jgi:hypothetical protein